MSKSMCQEEKENDHYSIFVSTPKLKRDTLGLSDVPHQNSTKRGPYKRSRVISDLCPVMKSTNMKPRFEENLIEQTIGTQFKIFEDRQVNENLFSANVGNSPDNLFNILREIELRAEDLKMQLVLEKERVNETSRKYSLLYDVCQAQQSRLELLQSKNSYLEETVDKAEKRVVELSNKNAFYRAKIENRAERSSRLEQDLHDLKKLVSKTAFNKRRSSWSVDKSTANRVLSPCITNAEANKCFSESVQSRLLKVSHCLEETNVSQLQKLLLSCTVENEILNSKLEDAEENHSLYLRSPMNIQSVNMKTTIEMRVIDSSQTPFNKDPVSAGETNDESRKRGPANETTFEDGKSSKKFSLPRFSLREDKGCQSFPVVLFSPFHVIEKVQLSLEDSGYLNITPKNDIDKEVNCGKNTNATAYSSFSFSPKWKSSTPK